jgi:hypothetical protein
MCLYLITYKILLIIIIFSGKEDTLSVNKDACASSSSYSKGARAKLRFGTQRFGARSRLGGVGIGVLD